MSVVGPFLIPSVVSFPLPPSLGLEGLVFLKSVPVGSWEQRGVATNSGQKDKVGAERSQGDGLRFFPIETPGNFGRLPLGYLKERQAGLRLAGWKELGRSSRLLG